MLPFNVAQQPMYELTMDLTLQLTPTVVKFAEVRKFPQISFQHDLKVIVTRCPRTFDRLGARRRAGQRSVLTHCVKSERKRKSNVQERPCHVKSA
jgi:hypothetical protein